MFVSRDGNRTLAQAVCGSICDATTTRAPIAGWECGKCVGALGKAYLLPPAPVNYDDPKADTLESNQVPGLVRLYRGLRAPFEPERVSKDCRTRSYCTNSPLMVLKYAKGRKGEVLVLEVELGSPRFPEESWAGAHVRDYVFSGGYEDLVVA